MDRRNRYEQCAKRYRTVKAALARSSVLDRIAKAAPQEKRTELRAFLLEGLATSAAFNLAEGAWAEDVAGQMRRRAIRLRSFSKELAKVAEHAKNYAESEDSALDGLASPQDFGWLDPNFIAATNQCAKRAAIQARAFGQYTQRKLGGIRIAHELALAERVQDDTGKEFYLELAELLTTAYGAAGSNRTFSADQLRMAFNRHSLPQPVN